MVTALKSFFKQAVTNQQDQVRTEYYTFEQVTAQKFDSRIQLIYERKGYSVSGQELDHPNDLTDSLKTMIFRHIVRMKQNTQAMIKAHPWPDDQPLL